MLGYPTFYSQQFVSLDFVITSMISCFGQNVAIPSWSNMVICIAFQKILFGLQNKRKYGEKIILFSRMIKYSPSVSCDINNVTGINKYDCQNMFRENNNNSK